MMLRLKATGFRHPVEHLVVQGGHSEPLDEIPKMEAFRKMIEDAGFKSTSVEPILGGLVAIHGGWKI